MKKPPLPAFSTVSASRYSTRPCPSIHYPSIPFIPEPVDSRSTCGPLHITGSSRSSLVKSIVVPPSQARTPLSKQARQSCSFRRTGEMLSPALNQLLIHQINLHDLHTTTTSPSASAGSLAVISLHFFPVSTSSSRPRLIPESSWRGVWCCW